MSIVIGLLRHDFVAVISDSRSVYPDGSLADEQSQKIWQLSNQVAIASVGSKQTGEIAVSCFHLKEQELWPNNPQGFASYENIVAQTVDEMAQNPKRKTSPEHIAKFVLVGKEHDTFYMRYFSTAEEHQPPLVGEHQPLVCTLLPPELTYNEIKQELYSILHRQSLQDDTAAPEQLIEAWIQTIAKYSQHNPYINNIPQAWYISQDSTDGRFLYEINHNRSKD